MRSTAGNNKIRMKRQNLKCIGAVSSAKLIGGSGFSWLLIWRAFFSSNWWVKLFKLQEISLFLHICRSFFFPSLPRVIRVIDSPAHLTDVFVTGPTLFLHLTKTSFMWTMANKNDLQEGGDGEWFACEFSKT